MHISLPLLKGGLALACMLTLSACQHASKPTVANASSTSSTAVPSKPGAAIATPLALSMSAVDTGLKTEMAQLLAPQTIIPGADRLVVSKKKGILLLNKQGETLGSLQGTFGSTDHRVDANGLLLATVDADRQQAMITSRLANQKGWTPKQYLPRRDFKIDGVCLYQDEASNAFVFLVGEEGLGEQWLVASKAVPLATPQRIRRMSLPPESSTCAVDDAAGLMYVNEEKVGLWAYDAHPEAELARYPVGLRQPMGDIVGSAAGMAVVPGAVLLLDADKAMLHRYARDKKNIWRALPAIALNSFDEPEQLSVRVNGNRIEVLVQDERGLHRGALDWLPPAPPSVKHLPILQAQVQTDLVPSLGDAADDPAIWVHPTDAKRSRVLGTDKQGGLLVYDMQGRKLQDLRVGRLNNVDVRAGFMHKGRLIDLAVASNRDHDSLHVFAIDRSSGQLSELGQYPTGLKDIYGICMFKDAQGNIDAIANGKDGRFMQYRLSSSNGKVQSRLVRQFKVATQPEGCVADDYGQQLFVGEEDVAVWALDARAEAPTAMSKVIGVGEVAHADIEGLAFYRGARHNYLVISSQGNDSYVVVDGQAPYAVRGAFRIGLNAAAGIDGVSETDGLEVSSANLGGVWKQGMLVVQDGRKRMPEGKQNYKYVPWSAVADALGLE